MRINDLASYFYQQIRAVEEESNRVYEPMIGVVTDIKDPDKLMRVKVKLPVLSAADTTFWVPVVSLGAGKDRGWFFLPAVDDEVLVVFEHGDLNRPVVIGALWGGKDKSPKDNSSGSNPIRTIVSRGGSKVEFDDEKNTVTISDGGGKGELVIKSDDNKMTITAKQGDVCIQAPKGDLQIKCAEATFKASVNLDIRGQSNASISASGNVELKASGPITLFAGQTGINPGGTAQAAKASTSPADVADPLGG
ncbi:MAG: phage baseplate assembly protein V [Kofleriaceae bacterium]|nr:phage baseplate assembly protein V [Myxococcales bacterium]MCB9563900.1 phage baseplate assembly protein V [Kofleriaceae bacterium]